MERALAPLVSHERCRGCLDFDNKQRYFRGELKRRQRTFRRAPTVRINVGRESAFEDSFVQLRMRTADEMRGRLSVSFRGEEGVDAGGVTREW